MPEELTQLTIDNGVATVTMNRPDKRNALSVELIDALHEAVGSVVSRIDAGDVRVVVLAGSGKSFCAGNGPARRD